jgi:hypothetical protein
MDFKWAIIVKLPQADFEFDSQVTFDFLANEVNRVPLL